jgi:hypothetical protein
MSPLRFSHFPLLIFIPPLSNGCDGPDKRAHYHIISLQAWSLVCDLAFDWLLTVMNFYMNIQQQNMNMEVFKYTATGDRLPELQQNSTAQYNLSNKESRGQNTGAPKDTKILQLYTCIMRYILRYRDARVRLQVPHK